MSLLQLNHLPSLQSKSSAASLDLWTENQTLQIKVANRGSALKTRSISMGCIKHQCSTVPLDPQWQDAVAYVLFHFLRAL
jgi:hypothetical protein